jgi:hypothetical protein
MAPPSPPDREATPSEQPDALSSARKVLADAYATHVDAVERELVPKIFDGTIPRGASDRLVIDLARQFAEQSPQSIPGLLQSSHLARALARDDALRAEFHAFVGPLMGHDLREPLRRNLPVEGVSPERPSRRRPKAGP